MNCWSGCGCVRVCACAVYGCRPQAWFDCNSFAHIFMIWTLQSMGGGGVGGRADISKPLLKKGGKSWFPLQSLPCSSPGAWDSGPNARQHRRSSLCEDQDASAQSVHPANWFSLTSGVQRNPLDLDETTYSNSPGIEENCVFLFLASFAAPYPWAFYYYLQARVCTSKIFPIQFFMMS